jgi:Holliday junction DNA helicase RuvA
VNAIKSVKGIGLKSAQRIIVDLKDKIGTMHNAQCTMHNVVVGANNENMEEAVAALVALGFQKAASVKVVEKLMKEDATMAVGKIVKRALSMM